MATEETLVLVKPDGVARGLTGAILARIEAKGYSLVDIRLVEPDRETLERHYAEHEGKPFYEPLLEFMMSGPSVAIRLAGNRVIEGFRSLAGTTDPTTAAPGTIRGDSAGTGAQGAAESGPRLGQHRFGRTRTGHLVPLIRRSSRQKTAPRTSSRTCAMIAMTA